jgi:hypothetical protein
MLNKLKKNMVIKCKRKPYTYTIECFEAVEEFTNQKYNEVEDEDEEQNPFYGFYASTYYKENKKELTKTKKEGKPFSLIFFVDEEVELLLIEEERKSDSWRVLVTKAKNSKPIKSFECYIKTASLYDLLQN